MLKVGTERRADLVDACAPASRNATLVMKTDMMNGRRGTWWPRTWSLARQANQSRCFQFLLKGCQAWVLLPMILLFVSGRSLAADGLVGQYYTGFNLVNDRIVFDGLTLVKTEISTFFDFWGGSQWDDWNPIGSGPYSVHWTGYLQITNAGDYGFGTISDDGSEIWIDGVRVVDNHEEQWYDWQEAWCYLGVGNHAIEITFFENQNFSGIEVWWLKPERAPSSLPYSGDTFHTTPPSFNADTRWEILSAPFVQTEVTYVNPRLRIEWQPAGTGARLAWQGFSGVTYQIETSTNLHTWQDFGPAQNGWNGLMSQAITPSDQKQFFRLRLQE